MAAMLPVSIAASIKEAVEDDFDFGLPSLLFPFSVASRNVQWRWWWCCWWCFCDWFGTRAQGWFSSWDWLDGILGFRRNHGAVMDDFDDVAVIGDSDEWC
jgi:hypothetical protein